MTCQAFRSMGHYTRCLCSRSIGQENRFVWQILAPSVPPPPGVTCRYPAGLSRVQGPSARQGETNAVRVGLAEGVGDHEDPARLPWAQGEALEVALGAENLPPLLVKSLDPVDGDDVVVPVRLWEIAGDGGASLFSFGS